MKRSILKYFTVFTVGNLCYGLVEVLFRGFSHISMGVLGGLSLLMIHNLNNKRRDGLPLIALLTFMTIFITTLELFSGMWLNLSMNLNIWDYSQMPLNYKGQICLPFSIIWFFLSNAGCIIDEWLRKSIFLEPYFTLKQVFGIEQHDS